MDLSSSSIISFSNQNPNMFNVSTMSSLPYVGLTVASLDGAETEHDCLVLKQKVNQEDLQTIVSKETKFWITVMSSAGLVPLLFLVGVPGNLLSAAVFYRLGLKERINVCVFCLALADIVVITVTFLLAFEEIYDMFVGPLNFFIRYFVGLTGFIRVSMFLSAVIAAERCFCVVSPLHAQRMFSTRTVAIFIISVSLLLVAGMQVVSGFRRTEVCVFDPLTNTMSSMLTFTEFYKENKAILNFFGQIVYGTAMPTLFFVVVVVTTVITAVKLGTASRWRQQSSTASGAQTTGSVDSHMVALTRMLIATSLLFVVCLSPILIMGLTSFFVPGLAAGGQYTNLRPSLYKIINVCRCVNSSFNFFIYYRMGSRFRQTLRKILPGKIMNKSMIVSGFVDSATNSRYSNQSVLNSGLK